MFSLISHTEKYIVNYFIWNQIKIFVSPIFLRLMYGFLGVGVACGLKGSRISTLNFLTMAYDRMKITRRN